MAYLNKVMLIGNLGKDPEIRISQNTGRKCASFSLATSRRYRDNNGEQKEQTTWHNVVGWGKIADIVEQLGIAKGTSLYIEGELTNRSWTDQNGQKRYVTEVNMVTFQLLTPRNTPQHQPSQDAHGNMQGVVQGPAYGTDDDDDLPF
ncbi:MAG: single-stranded DNA-binding protein [Bacteroidales bacterium]|nr:single-stranded DNA-binding protein [Bacteroidales bacterium]